jgi:hypothetical protein
MSIISTIKNIAENAYPGPFSLSALAYASQNSATIASFSSIVGVPALAVAASIVREISRGDTGNPLQLDVHNLIDLANATPAFLGFGGDLGEGRIKLSTAKTIIQDYTQNPDLLNIGIQLGLTKYVNPDGTLNISKIVNDLEDTNNSLTFAIEALVVRNGVVTVHTPRPSCRFTQRTRRGSLAAVS